MTDRPAPDDPMDALEELLARWFAARDRGESPDPRAICADHPALLSAFERIVGHDARGESAVRTASGRPEPTSDPVGGAIPAQIGEFEIASLLGVGGRGRIYLARQRSLGRIVALKVVPKGMLTDPVERRRLLREAELAASLDHRNIVPIYHVGETDDHAYIVMKWLPGPALNEMTTPLLPEHVARIGATIARALHAAHEAGVIHRDVKPANIMMDPDEPCILDFGLARSVTDMTRTQDGRVSGTLPYMSPEQLREGDVALLDGRTDVYSLGATLYELASGAPPFKSPEPAHLIREILTREPAPLRAIPRDLQTIILRALEKDRERRFLSARELADDLDRFLGGHPIRSRHVGVVGRGIRFIGRHRRASTLVAAVAAVALALGGALWWQASRAEAQHQRDEAAVRVALDRGRYSIAERLLTALEARRQGAARPGTPVARLRSRLEANVLLEELLDELQEWRGAHDRTRLLSIIDAIDSRGGPGGSRSRVDDWHVARAMALAVAGRPDPAKRALASVRSGRARAAVEAFVSERPWPWTLPPRRDAHVSEHVFAAIAMRLALVDAAARRAEIDRALAIDRTDYRARLQDLHWLAWYGTNPEAVWYGFRGLLSESGEHSRSVSRSLLRQAVALGPRERIVREIDAFTRRYSRAEWNGPEIQSMVLANLQINQRERANDLLREALERYPKRFGLWMLAARLAGSNGHLTDVANALDRAEALASHASERRRVRLARLGLRERDAATLRGEARRSALEGLVREARQFAGEVDDALTKSDAWTLVARVCRKSGRIDRAKRAIDEALTASETAVAFIEAIQIAGEVARRGGLSSSAIRENATEGRRLLRRLESLQGVARVVEPRKLAGVYYLDAWFAAALGRNEDALRSIDKAHDSAEVEPAFRSQLERLSDVVQRRLATEAKRP